MTLDFDRVKADALGRWPGILERLGIDVGNGKHCPCPVCGGKDRFIFDNKESKGTWHCQQCDPHAGDGFSLIMKILGIGFKEACEEVSKINGTVPHSVSQKEKPVSPDALRKLFEESRQVKGGDAVSKYLHARGLSGMPKTLRYTTKCWETETGKEQRAMLAIFTLPDGEAVTMHRTYIDGKGNKLQIQTQKKMMPTLKKMPGGAVRLYTYNPDAINPILGICEGIETAIACHEQFDIPVWAALSTSLMEKFEPPKEVSHMVIFADNDMNFAGQKAAYVLANRLAIDRKIVASVEIPDEPGDDFLDQINRQK